MKTLYESILDDEDILMSNIKKDSDNPFYILANLSEEDKNNEELVLNIIKNLEFPKHVEGKNPFNKECLGVKMCKTLSDNGMIYQITYDKDKKLKYYPGYKEKTFAPTILVVSFLNPESLTYKYSDEFLMNGCITVDLGYRQDVKDVFGNNTIIKNLLKKWTKKYNIKIF